MRLLIFVLAVSVLAACTNSDSIPGNIIAKQKMETIIWQLIQSDEYINIRSAKDTAKKISTEKMKIYQQVLDLNAVSMAEFKKSYLFYMEHPDISKEMFDSISVRANRQHMDIYNGKKDSLKPVPAAISPLTAAPGNLLKKDSVLKSRLSTLRSRRDTTKHDSNKSRKRLRIDSVKRAMHS
jgi:hypothetical protein